MNSSFENNEITMDGRGSGRLRGGVPGFRVNRIAGLVLAGAFGLTLGLGTAAAQALAGTAGDCPVDSPANPLCTPKG